MAVEPDATRDKLEEEIAGLDALDIRREERAGVLSRGWSALWPKLTSVALLLLLWQVVVWTRWKPEYALPGPRAVIPRLGDMLTTARFWHAVAATMRRAVFGFGLAIVLGSVLGVGVSRSALMRRAIGSFVTGLQSMPSVAWFPLAIILFGLTESAIMFVIVIGAAPSIANGLVGGVDQIPPLLLRAGRVLGARGSAALRHVVLPAALPQYVSGLKQGWAFSWRSLMAGELLVVIAHRPSIGTELHFAQENSDPPTVIAVMIVIFFVSVLVDGAVFTTIERRLRHRRGLVEVGAA